MPVTTPVSVSVGVAVASIVSVAPVIRAVTRPASDSPLLSLQLILCNCSNAYIWLFQLASPVAPSSGATAVMAPLPVHTNVRLQMQREETTRQYCSAVIVTASLTWTAKGFAMHACAYGCSAQDRGLDLVRQIWIAPWQDAQVRKQWHMQVHGQKPRKPENVQHPKASIKC